MIIGVDYHPSFQAIAFCMEETGECGEQELSHSDGQAEKFSKGAASRNRFSRSGLRLRHSPWYNWPFPRAYSRE